MNKERKKKTKKERKKEMGFVHNFFVECVVFCSAQKKIDSHWSSYERGW